MNNIYSIKNKIIVITGATGYLGSKMVEDLSLSGAIVISISRDMKKLKDLSEKLSLPIEQFYECDISQKNLVENVFCEIVKKFKRIDVLVNNAYFGISKKFNEYSKEDWYFNLDGTVLSIDMVSQTAIKYMKSNQSGRIINISSMYSLVAPDPSVYSCEEDINPMAYGVFKSAINQYTRYLAMKLAKYNINVNTVSYGPFPNPEKVKDVQFISNLSNKTFLKRVGRVEEVTAVIYFLSLDQNSFLTGQNIIVDGGWTSW